MIPTEHADNPTDPRKWATELYQKEGGRVYSLAKFIVKDERLAAEITLDVFLYALESAKLFDSRRGSVLSWLITLAQHRSIDRLRAARDSRVKSQESQFQLSGNLKLTEATTRLVDLTYFRGYTTTQIAEQLEIPQAEVLTRLSAAVFELCQACKDIKLVRSPETEEYHAHLEQIIAAYALGALDLDADRTLVEDLIAAEDPITIGLVKQMFKAVTELGLSVPQVIPPAQLNQELLQRAEKLPIRSVRASPFRRLKPNDKKSVNKYGIGIGVTAFVIVCAMIGLYLSKATEARETRKMLTRLYVERDSLVRSIHNRDAFHGAADLLAERLAEPGARTLVLASERTNFSPLKLVVSSSARQLFLLHPRLPNLDSSLQYRLWSVGGGSQIADLGPVQSGESTTAAIQAFQNPNPAAVEFVVTAETPASGTMAGKVLYRGASSPVRH